MTRKQLFVDWETLNKLIKLKDDKTKAKLMPIQDPLAHAQPPGEADWFEEVELADLEKMIGEAQLNATEKVAYAPDGDEQLNAVAEMRNAFVIDAVQSKTVVVLVIVDNDQPQNNEQRHVHCQDGEAFAGYVKDVPKDAYIVDCVDFLSLGVIPVSFTLSLPHTGGWHIPIPMAEAVVEKLLPKYYKRVLNDARHKYPKPRYEFHFLQMQGCG